LPARRKREDPDGEGTEEKKKKGRRRFLDKGRRKTTGLLKHQWKSNSPLKQRLRGKGTV